MKKLIFTSSMIFLLALPSLAQDPDFEIIVGTVYVDSGMTDFLMPIYLTAPDSICFFHIPISWLSADNGIRAVEAALVDPFDCDGFSDSVHLDEGYIDLLAWCSPPYSIWPALHQLFINIRFEIDSNASPQIVSLDTTYSQRNGGLMLGACNGINEIVPTFTPGYIYYGLPNSAEEISSPLPGEFTLLQNYPNPFSHKTQMEFSLKSTQTARIEIFNLEGRLLDVFVYQNLNAGNYKINWEPEARVPSGIYFYRLTCGAHSQVKKYILLR